MTLEDRLRALGGSPVPTWVFDADRFCFRWANDRALELWQATDRDELLSRDFSDMTASTRARIQGYIEGFRKGASAEEDWTLYPRGKPTLMRLYLSGVELDDGRIGVLIQAFVKEGGADPDLARSIEALRHTSVLITLLGTRGEILIQNPASIRAFGVDTPFTARFADVRLAAELLRAAGAGEVFRREIEARTRDGDRWHAVEARRFTDPATGTFVILVHQTDESERVGAQRLADEKDRLAEDLRATLAVVERQRQEILSLSAPILEVSTDTLALPIIGALDAARSAEIAGRLMHAITARAAARVILDLTGADVRDASSAEHLTRMARAIRLLGARTLITGIPAPLARALVEAGVDLSDVVLLRSLKEGLRSRQ